MIAGEAAAAAAAPEVVDDLLDLPGEGLVDVRHRPENAAKLARRVAAQPLKLMHPPRAGKKLLVLDIDYTLFDHRSTAEAPHELARPFLHPFLTSAYEDYGALRCTHMQLASLTCLPRHCDLERHGPEVGGGEDARAGRHARPRRLPHLRAR